MKKSLIIAFVLLSHVSFSQKEANNWYFGKKAGVSFNGKNFTALTNGQINTLEGCATISNSKGKLLFYTDGQNIWDSTHKVTPNGSGLKGNSSSTQSAIIVPKPENPGKYFIFTVSAWGYASGLNYSEFDMTLNSGKGDIISGKKNIHLVDSTSEKVTAVQHFNGKDYWVCTHRFNSDTILTYLLTSSGVSNSPVKSLTGQKVDGLGWGGQMKISPDGTKIAYANNNIDMACIGDFDSKTGKVSNIWSFFIKDPYGLEFSASSKYLYIAETFKYNIYQFYTRAQTKSDFLSSMVSVDTKIGAMGSLQMGPDKKIYIARVSQKILDVIHAPDSAGKACRVRYNYVDLSGKICDFGLPAFIQSYFDPNLAFNGKCFGDTAWLSILDSSGIDSVHWDFGDTASGTKNFAKGFRVYHLFSDTGKYLARSISFLGSLRDTAYLNGEQKIYLGSFDDLGSKVYKCFDDTITLNVVNDNMKSVRWSTGSNSLSSKVIDSGYVSASKYYGSKCYSIDSVKVVFYNKNAMDGRIGLGKDLFKCNYDSVKLNFNDPNAKKYWWSNGKHNEPIFVYYTDTISIKAYYGGSCYGYDTVVVSNYPSNFTLGPDTIVCEKKSIMLGDFNEGYIEYLWGNKSIDPFFITDTAGKFYLRIKDKNGCYKMDTILVSFLPLPRVNLGKDLVLCDKSSMILDAKNISQFNSYKWGTGSTIQTDTATKSGKYWVRVSNRCGSSIDTIKLKFITKPVAFLPYNVILCDSVPVVLNGGNMDNDVSYYWSNGIKTQYNLVNDTGLYKLRLSNFCGIDSTSVLFTKCLNWVTIQTEGNCINKPVKFSIDETIQLDSMKWDFGDKTFSNKVNDVTHIYSKPGFYTARLILFYNNRSDTVSTVIDIKNPKADFSVTDVCENESVKFINKTIDSSINNFRWKFGDGQSSLLNSPSHLYTIGGVSQTFNVTFVIQTKEGCSDSIIKAVTVNANPVSDFNFTLNQNKVDFEALQNGNTSYKWTFGNGDSATSNQKNYSYTYSRLNKNYTACLKTINSAGCFSKTCKEISVTVGISSFSKTSGFNIYPNPNSGRFTIEVDNPGNEVSIEVYNEIGELVKKVEHVGNVTLLDIKVSQGIYMVRVKNGNEVWNKKVVVKIGADSKR